MHIIYGNCSSSLGRSVTNEKKENKICINVYWPFSLSRHAIAYRIKFCLRTRAGMLCSDFFLIWWFFWGSMDWVKSVIGLWLSIFWGGQDWGLTIILDKKLFRLWRPKITIDFLGIAELWLNLMLEFFRGRNCRFVVMFRACSLQAR